jgi:hypothetical protein
LVFGIPFSVKDTPPSVADAADGLDAMSAANERGPYSLPPASIRFGDCVTRDPTPLKILFCPDLGFVEAIDPEVVDVCPRKFSSMGHHVTEKALELPSPMAAWQTLFVTGIGQRLGSSQPLTNAHIRGLNSKRNPFDRSPMCLIL